MTENAPQFDDTRQRIVLVTGPSGAGRSTAINALEDLGFEVIDNLPLSLLPRLLEGPPLRSPLALGLDVRNRDFSADALVTAVNSLAKRDDVVAQLLYIDASEEALVRRYSETRRRHPLARSGSPLAGIQKERDLLLTVRALADVLIDTSDMSVHDARAEIDRWFAPSDGRLLSLTVHSFSYKRGLPRGLDIVMDCRFLRNPHWDASLRALDGRDPEVAAYVAADPLFEPFYTKLKDLFDLLLPAHKAEGKSHLSIGFGCTGGQHRSVAVTERLAQALAHDGWHVSKRHREMERHAGLNAGKKGSQV
jgi:UPF0042 nucleotide-binding protein